MLNTRRYNTSGVWYKGNTHVHSTHSDGGKNIDELAELYSSLGYDFIFITDHWHASDLQIKADKFPILLLDGIELDGYDSHGSYYHIVCLGSFKNITRDEGLETALEKIREQGGITILAHPHWCGNTYDEALRWKFQGIEIYNHVCGFLNGKSNSDGYWNLMLRDNPSILGFASDDTHLTNEEQGVNGGWISVNSKSLSIDDIINNIKQGNYYSSCGPEIHSIEYLDGRKIRFKTSPVMWMRLVGQLYKGIRTGSYDKETLTEWTFEVPEDWEYSYFEIEDEFGKKAWTNSLFI